MLRFGEIAQHLRGRAVEDQPPAFVEQHRLVKHLEELRARLVDRDDHDLVVRHRADDLDDVLGILRGEAGGRFVEKVNVRDPIISRPMLSRLRSPPLSVFFTGLPTMLSRRSLRPSSISFALHPPGAIAPRKMRRADGRRELRFSPMVRCSSKASSCGM